MERRKFLGLGAGILAATMVPMSISAQNYRKTKVDLWAVKNEKGKPGIDAAIKALFGTDKVEEGKVKLKAPDIAENGAVVPVSMKAEGATRIALFQDANPEAAVVVFDVPKNGIPDYSIRIKMQQTGSVVAVAEIDGKLYKVSKTVKVTIGGCGG